MPDQDAQQAYLIQVEAASLMIPEMLMEDLEKSIVWRTSLTPGDPYQTAFYEGERHLVWRLREMQRRARARLER